MKSVNTRYVIPKKAVKDIDTDEETFNEKKIEAECLSNFTSRSKLSSGDTSLHKTNSIIAVSSTSSNSSFFSSKVSSFNANNSLKASYLSKNRPERLNNKQVISLLDSEDNTSIESNPMKNINFMSKEDFTYHLNKIQNFTKKFNEQKLMEEKMSLPLYESTDEEESCELPSIDLNVTPPAMPQHDQIKKEVHEEKSNNALDCLDLEDKIVEYKHYQSNASYNIIELDESPNANNKSQLKRKTIDMNEKIESRLEKVKYINEKQDKLN